MHYTVCVHTAHRRNYVVHNIACLLLGQVVLVGYYIEQLLAVTVLGYYVLVLALFEYFVYFQYARMILSDFWSTKLFNRDISLSIIDLAFENLSKSIFLIAL